MGKIAPMPSVDASNDQQACDIVKVFSQYSHVAKSCANSSKSSPIKERSATTAAEQQIQWDPHAIIMDGVSFARLMRDSQIQDGRLIDSITVDIEFARVKDKHQRRISFVQFCSAIRSLSEVAGGNDRYAIFMQKIADLAELDTPKMNPAVTKPQSSPVVDRLLSHVSRSSPNREGAAR